MTPTHILPRLLAVLAGVGLLSGCRPDAAPAATKPAQPGAVTARQAGNQPAATTVAPTPLDTLHDARLLAVRRQAARLDALPLRAWSRVHKAELYESTEGGEAIFYYLRGQLQKITAQYLGEAGQQRTTFYLLDGQLTLALEHTYHYNRPITWDAATARANADPKLFDFAKSVIITTRSYFNHGELLSQTGPVATDSALVAGYRQREQQRLTGTLRDLLALAHGK